MCYQIIRLFTIRKKKNNAKNIIAPLWLLYFAANDQMKCALFPSHSNVSHFCKSLEPGLNDNRSVKSTTNRTTPTCNVLWTVDVPTHGTYTIQHIPAYPSIPQHSSASFSVLPAQASSQHRHPPNIYRILGIMVAAACA